MDYDNDEPGELIHDLRQVYANDILRKLLMFIEEARLQNKYGYWYKLLKRDLFTDIAHKLDEDEKQEVRDKVSKAKVILVKHNDVLNNKSKNPMDIELVEDTLSSLEMHLKYLMEKHKMWGNKRDDDGL